MDEVGMTEDDVAGVDVEESDRRIPERRVELRERRAGKPQAAHLRPLESVGADAAEPDRARRFAVAALDPRRQGIEHLIGLILLRENRDKPASYRRSRR